MTLVATLALALQLMLPAPQVANAAAPVGVHCHFEPATHPGRHEHVPAPGKAGCAWCVLCGKLGTAVGPPDRAIGLPQRVGIASTVITSTTDLGSAVVRPKTGPVGARAPPAIA
jgi:hypothetical protein